MATPSATGSHRPLLVINTAFAPFGGAASRRVHKLIKYLDRLGRPAVVVTAPRVINALIDPELSPPSSTVVIRTRSLEPVPGPDDRVLAALRRLLNIPMIPDVSMLWAVCAIGPAIRAARSHDCAAILASAPEFSSFLVGAAVKRATGLPLILDYRDEWTAHPVKREAAAKSRLRATKVHLEALLEHRLGSYADLVIANTEAFRGKMIGGLGLDPARIEVITNGYDPEDFPVIETSGGPKGPRIVTHLGSIDHPSMLPAELIDGLAAASDRAGADVELRFIGNIYPELRRVLEARRDPRLKISVLGFLPARQALALLAESDLNLLIPEDLPGKERYHNLKLFDYLYSRKPLLVYGPRVSMIGETAAKSGIGEVIERGDVVGLDSFMGAWLTGRMSIAPDENFIASLSYGRIAERLNELIVRLEQD